MTARIENPFVHTGITGSTNHAISIGIARTITIVVFVVADFVQAWTYG